MKKKIGFMSVLMILLVTLIGCSNSPQAQFIKQINSQSKTNYTSGEFSMGISEFKLATSEDMDNQTEQMTKMILAQVENMKVTGDFYVDSKKDEKMAVNLKVEAMGLDVPFNMVMDLGDKPAAYVSTDFIKDIYQIMGGFSGVDYSEVMDFTELEGRYLDVLAAEDYLDGDNKVADTLDLEEMKKNQAEFKEDVNAFLKSIDKDSFKKEEDTLFLTLNKKDMINLMKKLVKFAEKEGTKEEQKEAKKLVLEMEESVADLKDLHLTVELNQKTNASKITFTIVPADATEYGFEKFGIYFDTTPGNKKDEVKMPAKDKIIGADKIDELVESASGVLDDESEDNAPTAEEFAEFKKELSAQKENYSKEELSELLATLKPVLSEEQYKELENELK